MRKSLIIGFLAFLSLLFFRKILLQKRKISISREFMLPIRRSSLNFLTAAKIINLKKFRLKIIKNKLKLRKFKMEFLNRKNI